MTSTSAAALPPEDAATLRAIEGCELVDLMLADTNGLLRGKRVAVESLEKVYTDGICLPMSLLAAHITGDTIEETGLGYDIGDEDRLCRPVPGSLRPVPWAPRPMAQLLLSMQDGHGAFQADPRAVLARVLERFAVCGLTPVVAAELEFYLLDAIPDARGHPQTLRDPHTGLRSDSTQVYYMPELDAYRDFTDAVVAACRAQRVPADTVVAEYAPGQFEINLHHCADALAACDDALRLKRTVKAIAQQQGALASYMAKPFAGQAGSGLHLHISVLDHAGRNIFASSPDAPAAMLLHALAGLQHSAEDALLLFAPHANSYRRYASNAFVPLDRSWGFNNRTVALRIPYSDARNTRIEHRIAGADANPYLVAAAVLAGLLDGIERQLNPDPPTVGNAYTQNPAHSPSWQQAIERFLTSDFIAHALGERFRHIYGQQKRRELLDFQAQITDLDYAWYLRTV